MRRLGLTLGRKLKEVQALRSIMRALNHPTNATQVIAVRAIRDMEDPQRVITSMDAVDFTIFDEVGCWPPRDILNSPRRIPIEKGTPIYRLVPAEPDPKRKHWHQPNPKSARKGGKGRGGLSNGRGRYR